MAFVIEQYLAGCPQAYAVHHPACILQKGLGMNTLPIRFPGILSTAVARPLRRGIDAWESVRTAIGIAMELAAWAENGRPLDRALVVRCGYLKS